MHQNTIWAYQKLDGWPLWWNKAWLDFDALTLDIFMSSYIKNYVKNKDIPSPQNHNIVLIPFCQKNTAWKHRLHFQLIYPPNYHQINKRYTMRHREHFILRLHRQHHCPEGLKLHCNWANKGNSKYDRKSKTDPQLSWDIPRCHHSIPSVRHVYEWPLKRLIFVWGKPPQQSMQPFFHGLDCKRRQSYQTQRGRWTLNRLKPYKFK